MTELIDMWMLIGYHRRTVKRLVPRCVRSEVHAVVKGGSGARDGLALDAARRRAREELQARVHAAEEEGRGEDRRRLLDAHRPEPRAGKRSWYQIRAKPIAEQRK